MDCKSQLVLHEAVTAFLLEKSLELTPALGLITLSVIVSFIERLELLKLNTASLIISSSHPTDQLRTPSALGCDCLIARLRRRRGEGDYVKPQMVIT